MPPLRFPGGLSFPAFSVPPPPPALPYHRISGKTIGGLGCGDYNVAIFERGGGRQLAQVEWSSLSWNRILDDTSTAQVKVAGITGRGSECCGIVSSINPRLHEVGIIRSGVRVWCGPVTKVDFDPDTDTATINGADLSWWLTKRLIHYDHIYTQVDLAVMFADYVYDAMLPENGAGLTVATTLCGVLGDRQTLASDYQFAIDALGELARTGIDWTCIDRYMLAGGLVVPTTAAFTLVDEHFAKNPASSKDASVAATRWVVVGSTDAANEPVVGDAGGIDEDGVLIERVAHEDAILDPGSADFAAAGHLALTQGVPGLASQGYLSPDAPIELLSLVAGTRATLRLRQNCVSVDGDYRLSRIDTTVSDRADEQVLVSFQPVGVDTESS